MIEAGIGGATAMYGLVRSDPRSSWSPAMHAAAFRIQGLDAAYVPLTVEPERLSVALAGALALGFRGLNVGAPHKNATVRECARLDPVAEAARAVNTLVRVEGGWEGHNTDALALAQLLPATGATPRRALVIAAGGAARATLWACWRLGISVVLSARDEAEAEALRDGVAPALRPELAHWSQVPTVARQVDCVVNAAPCDCSHSAAISAELRADQVVVDWVYGGTELSAAARRVGARWVVGDTLLVRQGALANTLWTGLPAPEAQMAAACERLARGRA